MADTDPAEVLNVLIGWTNANSMGGGSANAKREATFTCGLTDNDSCAAKINPFNPVVGQAVFLWRFFVCKTVCKIACFLPCATACATIITGSYRELPQH